MAVGRIEIEQPNKMSSLLTLYGTASRTEWWCIALIFGAVSYLAVSVANSGNGWAILGLPIALLAGWIDLATTVRRLRDGGYSPWLVLLGFVPFVGWLITLVLCGFMPSKPRGSFGR